MGIAGQDALAATKRSTNEKGRPWAAVFALKSQQA
jgi:hypothetical protein